jgi:transcriptional regulator with XRE-family HTH domain
MDNIDAFKLFGIGTAKCKLAARAKARRLAENLTRETLAERSGVNASTLKRFESTGNASIESIIRIAFALGCLNGFDGLFPEKPILTNHDLESVERKRGRK